MGKLHSIFRIQLLAFPIEEKFFACTSDAGFFLFQNQLYFSPVFQPC